MGETQSLLQAGFAISAVAGPALGGVLIAVLGETNVLFIDAASYAVSFVLLGIWVRPAQTAPDDSNEPRGVLEGVRFLFRDRLLRAWMLSITGINVVWSALGVALPVLVLERYGDRPEVLGYVFAAFGLGSVAGALASFRIIGRVDGLLLATSAAAGQTVVLWLLLPDLPWPALAASGAAIGLFFPFLNSVVVTTRTMRTPLRLRPSVHTAAVTVATILAPLGALAAGPALGAYGLQAVLAAVLAANTLCGIAFAAAGLRERAAAKVAGLLAEEPGLVVDGEDETSGAHVSAGVARGRD